MEDKYYLYVDAGCINGPYDTPEECEDVFNDLCEESYEFSSNIVIVKIVMNLI